MADAVTVGLSREPIGPFPDWQSFWVFARGRAGWKDGAQVFVYLEAVSKCILESHALTDVPSAPGDAFEGRVFDDLTEVRWRRLPHGFVGHVIQEGANGEPVSRFERLYYLIGLETDEEGVFVEGRYPGKQFRYPVSSGEGEKRRAFITVVEYRRAQPAWPESPEQIEVALDAPLLIEHRLVSVGI